MTISNEFWDGFWANLLSNIAFVSLVAVGGYFAKGRLIQNLKNFIKSEVEEIITEVKK